MSLANGVTHDKSGSMPVLLPQHLDDLRKSGLSDRQIDACGFYSVTETDAIKNIIRWKFYKGELGPCLAIPFFDAGGNRIGCRLKPDRPRSAKDGDKDRVVKYESPKGLPNMVFVPPMTRAVIGDVGKSLVITEGEKKAAKADQEGFPCIGLVGVYGWQKKRTRDKDGKAEGDRELIDGLASVAWKGRLVYVCFDSDAVTNPNVLAAEGHLAETLRRHGAEVYVVRLPPGPGGEKVGLDDYLVAHGAESFHFRRVEAELKGLGTGGGTGPDEAAKEFTFEAAGLVVHLDPVRYKNGDRNPAKWKVEARRGDDVVGVGEVKLTDDASRKRLVRGMDALTEAESDGLTKLLIELAVTVEDRWDAYSRARHQRQAAKAEQERERCEAAAQEQRRRALAETEATASGLLADPALLRRTRGVLEQGGLVGEKENGLLLFLCFVSQVGDEPISVVVKGDSSAGKSHLVKTVQRIVPPSGYISLTGMSERALIYDSRSFSHVHIIIFEAPGQGEEGSFQTYIIRTLISEGQIRYSTTEKIDGRLEAREVVKEGPTGFITTTTAASLHAENETRLWSLLVDERDETTGAILAVQAKRAAGLWNDPDVSEWHAAFTWLREAGAKAAAVPFAQELARLMPSNPLRLRRDFPRLLSLIQTCAVLHQRQRTLDDQGRVVATMTDYAMVRELVEPTFRRAVSGIVEKTEKIIKAIEDVLADDGHAGTTVSYGDLVGKLKKSKAWITKWLKPALVAGAVDNRTAGQKGKQAELTLGQLPLNKACGLPTVEELAQKAGYDVPGWIDPIDDPQTVQTVHGVHNPQCKHFSDSQTQDTQGVAAPEGGVFTQNRESKEEKKSHASDSWTPDDDTVHQSTNGVVDGGEEKKFPSPSRNTVNGTPADDATADTSSTSESEKCLRGAFERCEHLNGPTPPAGAQLYYKDAHGGPASPEDCHMWTWSGASDWYRTSDHPPPR